MIAKGQITVTNIDDGKTPFLHQAYKMKDGRFLKHYPVYEASPVNGYKEGDLWHRTDGSQPGYFVANKSNTTLNLNDWTFYANELAYSDTDKFYPKFEGTYSDYNEVASDDQTKYTWKIIKADDGVGIKNIQEFYLASPLDKGVTLSTDGWTSDVQAIDSDKKYLWNYEKINYDNNTNYLTAPVIIGTFGSQGIGVKGVTEYYLASPLSEGIRKDTNGWTTEMQPLTPENKYLWNKEIIHYTDDESALKDKTEVLSGTEIYTDKADDSVVHVEVDGKGYQNAGSGKNLFNITKTTPYNMSSVVKEGEWYVANGGSYGGIIFDKFETKVGKTYTISFTYQSSNNSGHYTITNVVGSAIGGIKYSSNKTLGLTADGLERRGFITFTADANENISICLLRSGTAGSISYKDIQIEEGSTATPYEPPAPTPDYPIEIHSLNDFDVVSQKSEGGMIDGIEVGGRNYLTNTEIGNVNPIRMFGSNMGVSVFSLRTGAEYYTLEANTSTGEAYYRVMVSGTVPPAFSGIWTFSGEILIPEGTSGIPQTRTQISINSPTSWVDSYGNGERPIDATKGVWTKFIHTFEMPEGTQSLHMGIKFQNSTQKIGDKIHFKNFKLEKGIEGTPWTPAPEDITESDKHQLIDKTNILLSEPLRSVGDVKDRLFRDNDGLWKVERNVGERVVSSGLTKYGGPYYVQGYNFTTFQVTIPDKKMGFNTSISSHLLNLGRNTQWDAPKKVGYNDHQGNQNLYLYMPNEIMGLSFNEATVTASQKANQWISQNPITFLYVLATPTIEALDQELQDKLNNLRSFQDSNYLYTIVDKTNILPNYVSENLKPNLHATFKSKAWSGNNAGYPSVIGVYGDSAKMLYLSATAESMTFNADGTPNPSSQVITLTANLQNVSGNASFAATAYNGSTVVSNVALSGAGNTRTFNQAQFPASANRVQVRAELGNLVDTVTIVKLSNGSMGQNAVVGLLTNESITLPADKDGLVPDSSFTGAKGIFDVYDGITKKTGSNDVKYSVVSESNITVSIYTTGAYSVTAMTKGTTILNGYATLKAICNGVTIEKQLSVSKSLTGATGGTGAPGASSYTWIRYSPNADGSSMTPSPAANSLYIGVAITSENSAPEDYRKYTWALIKGADGKGISSTTITYGLSTTDTVEPTNYNSNVPTLVKGQYLWTKTVWKYTDNTTETGYTKTYIAKDGNDGEDGIPGKAGVGISSTKIEYARSTSGTVKPTSGWDTAVPTVAEGNFLWTKTTWTYTDNTTESGYTVARMGVNGAPGGKGDTGAPGASATSYWITASNNIIGKSQIGVINPTTITFKGFSKTGTANSVAYSGRFIIQTSTNGTTYTNRYATPSNTNESSCTYTIPSDSLFVKCLFYMAGGTTVLLDEQTVPIIESAEGIEVGGRNLLSKNNTTYRHGTLTNTSSEKLSGRGMWFVDFLPNFEPNTTYTLSNSGIKNTGARGQVLNVVIYTGTIQALVQTLPTMSSAGKSTFTTNSAVLPTDRLLVYITDGTTVADFEISRLKLEKGNKATDWTPAPEDTLMEVNKRTYNPVRYIRDWQNGSTANSSNHWYEIQAYDTSGENIALRKAVTATGTPSNLSLITDGITTTGAYAGTGVGKNYVQVDLGAVYYDITEVKVWHYHNDGRTYKETKTEVSADGINWMPIFDSYVEGEWAATPVGNSFSNTIARTESILQSKLAKVKSEAYADGLVTVEEQARIDDVKTKLAAAKKYAEDQILADKTIKDTRNDNQTPAWYYTNHPRRTIKEFKLTSTIGVVSSEGTYGILETEIPWNDASGGPVKQTFRVNSKTFKRSGTTTSWTSWVSYDDIAETAKSIADGAASSALAANNLLADIASDSKLTPTEKKAAKKEWDTIVGEKPKIDSSADTYGITTQKTAYNTAYSALNTYLSSLLANLNTTSNIVGTVFRDNFRGYYNARQDLLNKIADSAKSLVDGIQIGGRNLVLNSNFATGSLAKWQNNGSVTFVNIDGRNTAYMNTSAGIYQSQILKDSGIHTFSFMAKALDSTTSANVGFLNAGTGASKSFSLTSTWQRYEFTTTVSIATSQIFHIYSSGKRYYITDIQLEKGNKATDWTPAPEDARNHKAWANSSDGTVDFTRVYPNENLLLESNQSVTTSLYEMKNYPLTDDTLTATDDVVITLKGSLGADRANFNAYNSGGMSPHFPLTHIGNGIHQYKGKWSVIGTNSFLRIYQAASTGTSSSTIEWIKLERGTTPTIYTTNTADSLSGSVMQYVGFSPLDSDKPSDYEWIVNPEYTKALSDESLTNKADKGDIEDINTALGGKVDNEAFKGVKEIAEEFAKSYEAFISDDGKHKKDLEALEGRIAKTILDLEDKVLKLDFINSYMTAGDEGLLIGSKSSPTKMLLSSDSLLFVDREEKVAEFASQSFTVNKGSILEGVQIGEHKVSKFGNGQTVFQWV